MAQKSAAATAPFLKKTYKLVDDSATDDVISWGDGGKTFVVWNAADFATKLLPSHFKHNNFSSFIRQLNTYGFKKVVPDRWEFATGNFKRGQPGLLSQVRRRKAAPLPTGDPSSSGSGGEEVGSTSTSSHRTTTSDLSDENEKLKQANQLLSTELAQAQRQYLDLMAIMKQLLKAGGRDAMDGGEKLRKKLKKGAEEGAEGLKLFGVWLKGSDGDQATNILVNM